MVELSSKMASGFSESLSNLAGFGNGRAVYAENYGCSANRFDFEIMLAHLTETGYRLVDDFGSADIILVNTCGVKKPTEDRVIQRLRVFSRFNKPLIIAGCLPKINLEAILKAAPNFSAMLDPGSVDKILSALKSAESGERNRVFSSQEPSLKLEQPKLRLNNAVEVVLISEGCAGTCAFCCVRFARGALFSFPKEVIVRRISQAVSEGVGEVWLTSQDNGAYGLDLGTNLSELLRECCRVDGKFLIRVGMMNPDHMLLILPEIIDAYKNDKIFKFLHLPVQSGDNETLKRMNRRYTVEEFKEIVDSFREEIPEITLATDVICGFPGESCEAFEKTIRLVEEIQPDVINISKFFPRPNTPAEKMAQLDAEEVKDRSRRLTEIVKRISFNRNKKWLNWEGEVLADEKGEGSSWIGRNFAYKPIVIKTDRDLFRKIIRAKVTKAYSTYLEAELLGTE